MYLHAEKPIEVMKPIRKEEGRKVAGKFQGEPTYLGMMLAKLKSADLPSAVMVCSLQYYWPALRALSAVDSC